MIAFWAQLPADRVLRLVGADAETIAAQLDPLPAGAPVVIAYLPHAEPNTAKVAEAMLGELAVAAVELFPQWLPAASAVAGTSRLAIAAVRAAAHDLGAATDHFGPFLADLAECGLKRRTAGLGRFSPEMRAAGLIRVLKQSYGKRAAAILIPVTDGLPADSHDALVSACEWLAQHGRVSIWLAGAARAHERIPAIDVMLPRHPPDVDAPPEVPKQPRGPAVLYPPLAGRPHPGSAAEQMLEAALERHSWASGRAWNHTYDFGPLVNPVRLDLWWRDERFAVEIDGPEHRGKWRYAADRRRDRLLHNDGVSVLRFTNAEVLDDLDAVLAAIEQFLHIRRAKQWELSDHA